MEQNLGDQFIAAVSGPELTRPQQRALAAVRDLGDELVGTALVPAVYVAPRQVAQRLWPDSPGWKRVSRRRDGEGAGAAGATMPMKAATLLWRLQGRGLVERRGGRGA